MLKQIKKHLQDNNMTYGEHFSFAFFNGLRTMKASILLIIHALFPCYFHKAGSNLVNKLNKTFTEHNELFINCKDSS